MSWAFYNSNGEIINGSEGAWQFYSADGEVQSTGTGGGAAACGECDLLTSGLVSAPELVFSLGKVIWI